jgi:nucleoside-diphosphate-sugar epimerase
MKVFVTGCSGLLGSELVPQLVAAGHQVIALSRTAVSDAKLIARGATPVRGTQLSLDILANQAAEADAVIHAAFPSEGFEGTPDPNFFVNACREDREAIAAIGDRLVGTNKPFIYASGTLGSVAPDEETPKAVMPPFPRALSDEATLAYAAKGVRAMVVRIPPVMHGPDHRHPFITAQIDAAKKAGYAGYIGDGSQVWPSAHVADVARVFVLALEKGPAGASFNAVQEDGIPIKSMAEFIGKKLGVPTQSVPAEKAAEHFGFVGMILGLSNYTTTKKTREWLGWEPKEYGLFEEIDRYEY